jgi:hypothetical protein
MKDTVEMVADGMIYIHTKFHYDWYRHSSHIKVISQKFERPAMLVLVIGRIYDVH